MVPSLLPPCSVSGRMMSAPTRAEAAKPRSQRERQLGQHRQGDTYIDDDPFVQQALLLGSHDKIVGAVLVVNNVLKINP